ncbi:MAG: hypothetical protein KatS3mg026_1313 [Bacteroidia bacterium]|nr:MAG: hypothetical protein KatS3mg026_1313 [Bacteroidia bacterium]
MDTGILHTHHLLGVLLVVLVGLPAILPQWAARLRWVHMVLDTLLLLTGVYLLFRAPAAWTGPYLTKYVLVLAAIGLAIVGSRRKNKRFSMAAFLLLAYAYGLSLQRDWLLRSEAERVKDLSPEAASVEAGQALYTQLCARCHGADGQAGYQKSPSLHPAQNPDTVYWAAVIKNGKGLMPGHPYLTEAQVSSLVAFLRTWQR